MIRFFLIFLVFFVCAGYIISLVYSFAVSIKNPSKKIEEDKKLLLDHILNLNFVLIPLNSDEIRLISTKQIGVKRIGGLANGIGGTYTTIYDEPIFHYGINFYDQQKKSGIAVAVTHGKKFIYYINPDATSIYIDDHLIGHIAKSGVLKSSDGKEVAMIDRDLDQSAHAVYINGREVGKVANPQYNTYVNQRAFTINANMSGQENTLFLSLTLLNLIINSK